MDSEPPSEGPNTMNVTSQKRSRYAAEFEKLKKRDLQLALSVSQGAKPTKDFLLGERQPSLSQQPTLKPTLKLKNGPLFNPAEADPNAEWMIDTPESFDDQDGGFDWNESADLRSLLLASDFASDFRNNREDDSDHQTQS